MRQGGRHRRWGQAKGDPIARPSIARDDHAAWTEGLTTRTQRELHAEVVDPFLVEAAAHFLQEVIDGLKRERAIIQSGDLVQFGSWPVEFKVVEPRGPLVAHEMAGAGNAFMRGVSRAARSASAQREVCHRFGAPCAAPPGHHLVVMSAGVLLPDAIVEGARHGNSEAPMTGWFLRTTRYAEGDPLSRERVFRIVADHPHLGRFLGLPPGYTFRAGEGIATSVVYDSEVAASIRSE